MSKHTGTEGRLQHLSAPRMSLFYAFSHAAKSWLDLDFLVAGGIQYDHGLPSFCVGLPPNSASLPVRWSWNRRPVSRILLCGGSDKHSPVIGGIGGMAVWLCHTIGDSVIGIAFWHFLTPCTYKILQDPPWSTLQILAAPILIVHQRARQWNTTPGQP